jgi:MFS family permease
MSTDAPSASSSPASQTANGGRMAWVVLAVLLLFSIAAPINQFKVPPIMPVLMQALNLSVGRAGLLMSVYAITGLLLAIPAGFIVQKAGFRVTTLLAGGIIILGTVWGALSPDVGSLLASRVVEGMGTSFMAVLAPAVVAVWFTANKRGVAMGIWANWVPIGSTAMALIAPLLSQSGTWRAVWWFGALYALVVTGLALFVIRPAPAPASDAQTATPPSAPPPMGRALRNRDLWLVGLTFAFFVMAFMSFTTFLPTYLSVVGGMPLSQAAQVASLGTIVAIFAQPFAGILSDRIGSRKGPYLIGMGLTALSFPLVSLFHGNALIALIILQGLVSGIVPPNIFSAAVEVVGDERLGGLAMGVVMVGQNVGMLVGPLIFGMLVESSAGWPLAFGSLSVLCLLGAIAGALAKVNRR